MALLKVNKRTATADGDGILYVLVMIVDEIEVYKIGVTQRPKIEERVCEILTSHFVQYRYFPFCRPKRFSSTTDVYGKEAMMHKYFHDYRYEPEKRFSGSTELFTGVPLQTIVDVYKRCIDGENILKEREDVNEISEDV